jgi:DNA adenine methylase
MSSETGGPLKRYGGKGLTAPLLIPHFAPADLYCEPFLGGGGVFFQLPRRFWRVFSVNDLDGDVVTFFRVLRDRCDDLVRVCSLTPYAMDEYRAAYAPVPIDHPDHELERARRMWVRSRQGFAGIDRVGSGWARAVPNAATHADSTESKLQAFRAFAATLRNVTIDNSDAVAVIRTTGKAGAFIYADPPYVAEVRKGAAYTHEMDNEQHRALHGALEEAVARGALVTVGGYASALYDELYKGWRKVEVEVALKGNEYASAEGRNRRRVETLWLSYGENLEIARNIPKYKSPARTPFEKALRKYFGARR